MPRLIVIKGVDEGRQFELNGAVLGIGRDASNPLRLHDTEISRRHAEFRQTLDGASYRIHDRESSNGLYVNGQSVRDALLRPGDQIQIGQTVLVYSLSRGESPAAADLAERIRMITRTETDFASQIVTSIGENEGSRILARPEEANSPWLRTRLANLAILYEASQAVSHILDLDQLLDRILELTFRSIEADRGCVMLRDAESGDLKPQAIRWRNPGSGECETMIVSRTITDHVLRERQGILVSDAAQDQRFAHGPSILRVGIREAICVPMRGRHETLGVLYLDTVTRQRPGTPAPAQGRFSEDHLALAIALAHQAALAIEETRYYQAMVQAERLAAVGQTIASLSHHIKNILQGLRSGTEILRMGMEDADTALLTQGWRIVEKNQGKIYDLVLDMLSYSKEREPNIEPTDLASLCADVVELVQPRARELGVGLNLLPVPALTPVACDPEGIHRSLLNLVGNALDAVEGREAAEVNLAVEIESPEWVLIHVRDNGPGIPPNKLEDIFKPFVSSKGSRGTGLGLAVSRKILREHGGDILVASTPGAGCCFTLRLPRKNTQLSDPKTQDWSAPLEPD